MKKRYKKKEFLSETSKIREKIKKKGLTEKDIMKGFKEFIHA